MAVFYATHGNGPWDCFFCGLTVTAIGQGTWDGNVHHVDGDKLNDVSKNLVMTHTICHQRHHSVTEDQKQRISEKLQGRPSPTKGMRFSTETNAKKSRPGVSNPFFGKNHTAAALSKMRKPRRRARCSDCERDFAINWLNRHKKVGQCTAP